MTDPAFSGRQAGAYTAALGLCLAGLVFAFGTLQVAGIDILVDAVGWLLVFNGLRPLEKPGGGIGPRAFLCLGLVGASATQLFSLGAGPAWLFLLLRTVLELALFLSLVGLFGRLLAAFGWEKAQAWFTLAFVLNAALGLLLAGALLLGLALPSPYGLLLTVLGYAARLLLAGLLVWLMMRLDRLAKTEA